MPAYLFRCTGCNRVIEQSRRDPPRCCDRPARRIFTPPHVITRSFEPHLSPTLGKPVVSRKDFTEQLKRLEDKRQQELEVVEDVSEWARYARIPGIEVTKDGKLECPPDEPKRFDAEEPVADPAPSSDEAQVQELMKLGSDRLARMFIREMKQ